jgi:hypothetical protein
LSIGALQDSSSPTTHPKTVSGVGLLYVTFYESKETSFFEVFDEICRLFLKKKDSPQ